MKLTVLGSSSSGNGYVIQSQSEAIIVEAGMPLITAKKLCTLIYESGSLPDHT
jgi:hypothetical protein